MLEIHKDNQISCDNYFSVTTSVPPQATAIAANARRRTVVTGLRIAIIAGFTFVDDAVSTFSFSAAHGRNLGVRSATRRE